MKDQISHRLFGLPERVLKTQVSLKTIITGPYHVKLVPV